ncbi:MAG: hypothetical protein K8I03_00380 [Ignavibacteria bacterium]|nr:hypothetical protein [Ignavibacteria bacterium]
MAEDINYHEFVERELGQTGLKIVHVTEDLIKKDLQKFSKFINDAFAEYYDLYKWRRSADEAYLLNPLRDKFKFSFCIFDSHENIKFINFTSILEGKLNNHFTFADRDTRGMNLAKYHIIKLCRTGIDSGYPEQIGYWPRNNNRSIILYLKMGCEISHINEQGLLIMNADNAKVSESAYRMLQKSSRK